MIWIKIDCLRVSSSITNEWPFQNHLLSKLYQLKELLVSGRPYEWTCWVSSVSLMNGHFKTIFWVKLHWLKELHLLGDMMNVSIESSSASLINSHFKIIFLVKLLYWLKEFCSLEDLNNETCREVFPIVTDKCHIQHYFPCKIIVSPQWALFPQYH